MNFSPGKELMGYYLQHHMSSNSSHITRLEIRIILKHIVIQQKQVLFNATKQKCNIVLTYRNSERRFFL